jgi:kynurenine formamidase
MRVAAVMLVVLLSGVACGSPPQAPVTPPPQPPLLSGTIVDLSHPYDNQTIFWPTAERFALRTVADGMTPGGFYYAANRFSMEEHGGTHVDAPRHFAAGRWTVDEIPIERLRGAAVVIDVSGEAARDADYQVRVADLQAWERQYGAIPSQSILLLRTGYSARWPDASRYLGTSERGQPAVALLHFPGLHPDAARWLVAERRPHAVGIDTASIDFGQSTTFESHRVLFEQNIPAFENLAALERLPPSGAVVVALPMKIRGGSGAPLRAIAILPAP